MNIRPIKTQADLKTTLERISQLMDAKPGTARGDELEILSTLAAAYERTHFPISAPDPIDAIRFRMEQMGYAREDLNALVGKNRASELLNRKRPLSLAMIRRLHEEWGLPTDVLIQPTKLTSKRRPAVRKHHAPSKMTRVAR